MFVGDINQFFAKTHRRLKVNEAKVECYEKVCILGIFNQFVNVFQCFRLARPAATCGILGQANATTKVYHIEVEEQFEKACVE